MRALEQEKTLETTEGTLVNLRRYLNRPNSVFDRFEVMDILQALVHLVRSQAHQGPVVRKRVKSKPRVKSA